MIIDWHTHVHPPREAAEPRWRGRCPATIENVLALHDEVGLDISVISSAGHYLKNFSRDEALPLLRESNEYMAAMRDRHKDKILAFATAIPGGGDAHLRELERAVREDDLRGVLISSSHRSRNILALLGSGPDIGRALVAEPGIPTERAAVLRKAFMATMEDPEFVAEMHKRNLEVEPLSGEDVQRIVEACAATPKELVEQARRYIGQ